MNPKDLTSKNTKKEIWEAYQEILQKMQEDKKQKNADGGQAVEQPILDMEDKKVLARVSDLNIEKITTDTNSLKINIGNTLNKLSDQIIEELKKLESVKEAIKIQNRQLDDVYKIKTEADTLIDLIEMREQKKIEFRKNAEEEEEKLKMEIEQKRRQWVREQEEHAYNLKIERKKEEDEYEFKRQIKDREYGEKVAIREKDLKARENKIIEQENDIKILRSKVELFPAELEKAKEQASCETKEKMDQQAKITSDFAARDIAKERDITKLRITSLEDAIKKQASYIHTLESQLTAANQKAQELAVKIIEAGGERESKKNEKDVPSDGKIV